MSREPEASKSIHAIDTHLEMDPSRAAHAGSLLF